MDDIQIPLLEGRLDDTEDAESDPSSLSTTQQYQREARLVILVQ